MLFVQGAENRLHEGQASLINFSRDPLASTKERLSICHSPAIEKTPGAGSSDPKISANE
jgi:hypothetical protein